jgi:hypothetical protein
MRPQSAFIPSDKRDLAPPVRSFDKSRRQSSFNSLLSSVPEDSDAISISASSQRSSYKVRPAEQIEPGEWTLDLGEVDARRAEWKLRERVILVLGGMSNPMLFAATIKKARMQLKARIQSSYSRTPARQPHLCQYTNHSRLPARQTATSSTHLRCSSVSPSPAQMGTFDNPRSRRTRHPHRYLFSQKAQHPARPVLLFPLEIQSRRQCHRLRYQHPLSRFEV